MRNRHIDYLRAIAVWIVMLGHFVYAAPSSFALREAKLLTQIAMNAYYGVTVFFVISGFVITTRMLERYGALQNVAVGEFYSFRAARIMPCLLLMMLLAVWVTSLQPIPNSHSVRQQIFYALTFRYNIYRTEFGVSALHWDVLWSLSIEEVFYLAIPWIYKISRRIKTASVVLLVIVLCGPLFRPSINGLFGYWGCFDHIALGCLTALAVNKLGQGAIKSSAAFGLLFGGLGLIGAGFWLGPVAQHSTMGPSIIAGGAAISLIGASFTRRQSRETAFGRLAVFFGQRSYELYLFHAFALLAVAGIWRRLPSSLVGNTGISAAIGEQFLLYAGLLWVTALLLGRYFSRPTDQFIRQLFSPFLNHPPAVGHDSTPRP